MAPLKTLHLGPLDPKNFGDSDRSHLLISSLSSSASTATPLRRAMKRTEFPKRFGSNTHRNSRAVIVRTPKKWTPHLCKQPHDNLGVKQGLPQSSKAAQGTGRVVEIRFSPNRSLLPLFCLSCFCKADVIRSPPNKKPNNENALISALSRAPSWLHASHKIG